MPPVSTISKDLPFHVALPYMRSRVMPGSSVTMDRRCPIIRLNRVDLPTFGRPITAIRGRGEFMKGSGRDFGWRMADIGCATTDLSGFQHPPSEIRHRTLVPLSFWKIAHQRIWDLKCLQVIYSRVTKIVIRFENPVIGSVLRPRPASASFRSFFLAGRNQGGTYA